jgi:short-subunit dehydrogenase
MTRGTALVTGASAGLGELFARALAAAGHDLILTARRADRLDEIAVALRIEHGVRVEVLPADLAAPDAAAALFAAIAARGLAVDLLVNNAGFGANGAFADMDRAMLDRMVQLNCTALIDLCHLALPGMIARRSGAILNVASMAGFVAGPWMTTYYASKAFVLSFSQGLHEEVKPHGIRVSALCPGPTRTEFFDVAGMNEGSLLGSLSGDPHAVVRAGLAALAGNQAVRVPGLANKAMVASMRLAPRGLTRWLAGKLQQGRLS